MTIEYTYDESQVRHFDEYQSGLTPLEVQLLDKLDDAHLYIEVLEGGK